MDFFSKFFHSFNSSEPGFIFMWILLAVGTFSIVIALERLIYLTVKSGFGSEKFMKEILESVNKDDITAAKKKCEKKSGTALAKVIKAGLDNASRGAEQIRNAVDEETMNTIPRLEKRTQYLATIGNVATLIGLMGTIYGLILSFAAVGKPGIDAAQKSTLLASGIAAAMNTTLSGLIVAIPSIVFYSLLKGKTQKIIDEIDEYSLRLTNALIEKSYRIQKFHISASKLKEGIGLHVTKNKVQVYTDNKLIKEITV